MIADCDTCDPVINKIVKAYARIYSMHDLSQQLGSKTIIPRFSLNDLSHLCDAAQLHFSSQPNVLDISSDATVVGDLYGNLPDLLRILSIHGNMKNKSILFLGNYVDYGEFSIESITLLLALCCAYPTKVFLLRGNHEFPKCNQKDGFQEEIMKEYNSQELWWKFNLAFSMMPFAAVINKKVFCVHGGISSQLSHVNQLEHIIRPTNTFGNKILADILYSYPKVDQSKKNHSEAKENNISSSLAADELRKNQINSNPDNSEKCHASQKEKLGELFGSALLQNFLTQNSFTKMIRSNEYVKEGTSSLFDGTLYTVYSAGTKPNTGTVNVGYVVVSDADHVTCHRIERKDDNFSRNEANFATIEDKYQPIARRMFKRDTIVTRRRINKAQSSYQVPILIPKILCNPMQEKHTLLRNEKQLNQLRTQIVNKRLKELE
ncbi:Ser/Thr protein phosphatase [Tritrichomonas foetus]|uniref:Serine/threonine-protein phosphatase n=1 Tax=Tritrichomonas foetus TaxID=1144522 RepID=A0A1J4L1Y1_9EUKA|nr:Ser/Thr protein phosphatase [Tritrichomonas foetus]|eukprot:OHT17527.1 Ser/Thr protein phosphatase [Tritrichomonas foetus]